MPGSINFAIGYRRHSPGEIEDNGKKRLFLIDKDWFSAR